MSIPMMYSIPRIVCISTENKQLKRPKTLTELLMYLESRFVDITDRFIGKEITKETKYNLQYALEQEAQCFMCDFNLWPIEDMIMGTVKEIVENNFQLPDQLELKF